MDDTALIAVWEAEEREPLVGWDFSHVKARIYEDPPPWSYEQQAANLMRDAHAALDIDTGGGEWLLRVQPSWPAQLTATEHYPPNVQLAVERLSPFGVQVVDVAADERVALPFDDGRFDLVLNRHGGLNIPEIARVLTVTGTLFTQQVHGHTLHDLLARFGATPPWPHATPQHYLPQLDAAGLTLVAVREHWSTLTFTDVGALVYYLHAIPWLVPHFRVATHLQTLGDLHRQVMRGELIQFATGIYLIEARKRAA